MILYRTIQESDKPLLYDSFKRTMLHDFERKLSREIKETIPGLKAGFMADKRRELEEFFERDDVVVLANVEDPDHVFGYAIYKKIDDALILHFAYLKTPFQRCGLFRKLIREHFQIPQGTPIFFTYKSPWPKYKQIAEKYDMVFKPEYRKV